MCYYNYGDYFMSNIKVVTICGSMKFKNKMMEIAKELELKKGYTVIQCIYGVNSQNYDNTDKEILRKLHFKKIEISDAIYVVNVDGYIGESTKKEIEYAKSLQKEILSLEPLHK